MIESGVKIVDIRTPKEWEETGVIPLSYQLMFFDQLGNFDDKKWLKDLKKIVNSKKDPIILICRSGNRTKTVGNFLLNQAGYEKVYHTKDGINGWIEDGREVIKK